MTVSSAPSVLGTPALSSCQGTKAVEIEADLVRDTSEVSITVIDKDTSEVLAHYLLQHSEVWWLCQLPIVINLGLYGRHKITVGPALYEVHENPEFSGGTTCSRIYNNAGTFVICTASIPVPLQATALGESSLQCVLGRLNICVSTPKQPPPRRGGGGGGGGGADLCKRIYASGSMQADLCKRIY
ncbi:hypothetical protein GB937_010521 [Aspergillus fischeri]|nr:hypothetical protein GB937_010521 [Aspergillus fischeri]